MKCKKILLSSLLIMTMAVMMTAFPVSAAKAPVNPVNADQSVYFGDVDITVNSELGFVFVTEKVAVDGKPLGNTVDTVVEPFGQLEKSTSMTFSHKIYDRNGSLMAKVYSTISGIYSEIDNWAEVTDITARISTNDNGFTYTTSKSGAYGYVNIYYYGVSAGTFRYQILKNGNIINS